ncbi:hypothetical protein N7492_006897 [Penicillium capsulatum]|uniref:Uncharacterized protein n=1 Tax=Penicillium capsulatum TaxID=69766 RepID=A0A9W9I2H6_9EURO|nr:hypothetical protein N7492_006897 [Penicillium capsulatum]KAJ6116731.1 hypothetical protein N7512_006456 [Penicillium capsulatum]
MHSKTLALLFLSASALTSAELEKKEYGDYYSSLMGDLDSLASNTDYMDYLTDLPTGYSHLPSEATGSPKTETDTGKASITAGPTLPSVDLPPASIQSVLATAIPASYLSQMANPSAASSIYREIQHGHYPDWYKSLPGNVKDWLSTHYADGSAAATGGGDSSSGSDSRGKGDVPGAAAPSGVVATGLVGAACLLAAAVML